VETNGQDLVRKVSNGVACLQRYRLSSDSGLAVRVLGGFAVGLQDCEPQRGESVDFQPFLMASRQSVSVMHASAELTHARREKSHTANHGS
jgi:hypothetical protein